MTDHCWVVLPPVIPFRIFTIHSLFVTFGLQFMNSFADSVFVEKFWDRGLQKTWSQPFTPTLTELSLINHSHLVQRLHFSPWTGILLIWRSVSLCWLSVHASVAPKCTVQSCIPHLFVLGCADMGVFWAMHFLLSDSVMRTVHVHYRFFGLHGDLGINVAWIVEEGFIRDRGPVKMETHVQVVLWYVLFTDIASGAPIDSSIEEQGI